MSRKKKNKNKTRKEARKKKVTGMPLLNKGRVEFDGENEWETPIWKKVN